MKRRKLLALAGLGIAVSCGVPMSQSTVLSTSQLALAEGKPMQLLTEFRISADHYLFFIYDTGVNPSPDSFYSDPDEKRSDLGSYRQGYITNGRTICFGTDAHLNDHWIEVYASTQVPAFGKAERVIALPLRIDSGRVAITNLLYLTEPMKQVDINPGVWTVYLLAFNLGTDRLFNRGIPRPESRSGKQLDQLTDDQLKANWEFERYQIILVPGFQTPVGVLHGTATVRGA
ncbi:hypothetical protein H6F86_00160 [Phormidium sp. FACHB-592]|uniref:Uncharacterized protein n=1 Tax=Stenomitos frigidus AS-A4 TaxID=2933935 RepID=A0ABV0KUG4_9CYAN|nr:hypothetical protein [Phormidium sp. FACHB-592]MBD2072347.1 hypothetical protein [Phormidium sp. FACHB-592]